MTLRVVTTLTKTKGIFSSVTFRICLRPSSSAWKVIGAFQRHVDALVAHQTDLFRAGHNRLNRRRCSEIGKAMLQSVFGEEAQILSDPRRRHRAAEGVVNAAQRRHVCGVQLARERET